MYIYIFIYFIYFYLSACKSSMAHFNSQHSPPLKLFFFHFPPFFIFFFKLFFKAPWQQRKESVYTGPELRAEAGKYQGQKARAVLSKWGSLVIFFRPAPLI